MFYRALLLSCISVFHATSALCTRQRLQDHLDLFFVDAISHDALPLAPNVKISSNGVMQLNLNTTAFANTTWLESPGFKIQVVDILACQAARYTVAREKQTNGTEVPALISVRVGLADNDGHITEIEITNVVKGENILFSPDTFEHRTPPLFNSSQSFPPGAPISAAKVLTRKEIIAVTENYVSGVQKGDKSIMKVGPACPRTENGQRVRDHCEDGDEGLSKFKWPIQNRRWIADPDMGIAFGAYIVQGTFGEDDNTWDLVNEFIAVKDGLIREVRAIMEHVPKGTNAIWPEDTARTYATT
ncbi:hypothetical protein EJ08DRAFT_703668 [Tothia fuscella]|uniref:DUF8021 domain-containing protein n=1 Tax=Tothia fuscella TaxID=1048955 RepID=A0A9P4TSA5_9PEZI|nr:hypothetical protein EJ08DRAFT_703668 [Tothia fuscella]